MNRRIFSLIGIGALAGSAACLLAKMAHAKKKSSVEFSFDDVSSDDPFSDDAWYRSGYILKSELREALLLLFNNYSDNEIADYSADLDCTDGDLREYWVDVMASLLLPVLNESWESCPRLEAYGAHDVNLIGEHGVVFDDPACILVNDQADCVNDRFFTVEHNIQLWLTEDGGLAVVRMFGFMCGPMVLGYSYLDYVVDESTPLPWSFREIMTSLYRLVEAGRAW